MFLFESDTHCMWWRRRRSVNAKNATNKTNFSITANGSSLIQVGELKICLWLVVTFHAFYVPVFCHRAFCAAVEFQSLKLPESAEICRLHWSIPCRLRAKCIPVKSFDCHPNRRSDLSWQNLCLHVRLFRTKWNCLRGDCSQSDGCWCDPIIRLANRHHFHHEGTADKTMYLFEFSTPAYLRPNHSQNLRKIPNLNSFFNTSITVFCRQNSKKKSYSI